MAIEPFDGRDGEYMEGDEPVAREARVKTWTDPETGETLARPVAEPTEEHRERAREWLQSLDAAHDFRTSTPALSVGSLAAEFASVEEEALRLFHDESGAVLEFGEILRRQREERDAEVGECFGVPELCGDELLGYLTEQAQAQGSLIIQRNQAEAEVTDFKDEVRRVIEEVSRETGDSGGRFNRLFMGGIRWACDEIRRRLGLEESE